MTSEDGQWLSSLGRNALIECNLLRRGGDEWLAKKAKFVDKLELVLFVAKARHMDSAVTTVSAIIEDASGCKSFSDICEKGIPDRIASIAKGVF